MWKVTWMWKDMSIWFLILGKNTKTLLQFWTNSILFLRTLEKSFILNSNKGKSSLTKSLMRNFIWKDKTVCTDKWELKLYLIYLEALLITMVASELKILMNLVGIMISQRSCSQPLHLEWISKEDIFKKKVFIFS